MISGRGVLETSWPQEGPKMAQDGPKEPKIAPLAEGKAEMGELGCSGLIWAALAYFRLQAA